jgi:hypothetical protein
MTRLRSSTFALPPSRFRLRASRYGGQVALQRTSRATADKSSFGEARSTGSAARVGIARACLAAAAQLRRRAAVTMAVAVMMGGTSLLACPVCFGADETPMIDGAKLGVLVMLAVLFAVQGGFVAFFLYLRRCAKRNAEIELDAEWSELQRSPRTS